jgi:hypothetical protein
MHTAERLVPDPSPSEDESATEKLRKYKSPDMKQIPAQLIQAGGETLLPEIHKLINSIWSKENLPEQWKQSLLYHFTRRYRKTALVIIEAYHYYQLHT